MKTEQQTLEDILGTQTDTLDTLSSILSRMDRLVAIMEANKQNEPEAIHYFGVGGSDL